MIEETKKPQRTKKVLITSLLIGTVIVATGTAFALFSDTLGPQTVALNSGTLDIEETTPVALVNADGSAITGPISPGDSFKVAGTITNNGNLAAKVRVQITPDTLNTGTWTNTYSTLETVLAAGGTLDLSTGLTGSLTYELGDSTINGNTEQGKAYSFTVQVDAMQENNTDATDWANIVTQPFTITAP